MGLAFITYVLQLINLWLLFQLVFSCEFQKKRSSIGVGIVLILISLCGRIGLLSSAPVELQLLVEKGTFMVLPTVLFANSRLRLLLLGVSYSLFAKFVFSSVRDIIEYFDLYSINAGILTVLLFSVVFTSVGFIIKKKQITIIQYVEEGSFLLIMVTVLGLMLLNWNGGIVYENSEKDVTLLIGWTRILTIVIATLFLAVVIGAQLLLLQKKELIELNLQHQSCIKRQTLQYHRLEAKDTELQSFKHDYKAHFTMIQSYLERGDIESAKQYVSEIGTIENSFNIHRTGNFVLDAILNQYTEVAEKENITIRVLGRMPKDVNIAETDLCTLFYNGMENALEAVVECEAGGTIRVEITHYEESLFIEIANPCSHEIVYATRGLVSSKKEPYHGIGTRNMISVAEKYHGNIEWICEDRLVTTKIKLKYK